MRTSPGPRAALVLAVLSLVVAGHAEEPAQPAEPEKTPFETTYDGLFEGRTGVQHSAVLPADSRARVEYDTLARLARDGRIADVRPFSFGHGVTVPNSLLFEMEVDGQRRLFIYSPQVGPDGALQSTPFIRELKPKSGELSAGDHRIWPDQINELLVTASGGIEYGAFLGTKKELRPSDFRQIKSLLARFAGPRAQPPTDTDPLAASPAPARQAFGAAGERMDGDFLVDAGGGRIGYSVKGVPGLVFRYGANPPQGLSREGWAYFAPDGRRFGTFSEVDLKRAGTFSIGGREVWAAPVSGSMRYRDLEGNEYTGQKTVRAVQTEAVCSRRGRCQPTTTYENVVTLVPFAATAAPAKPVTAARMRPATVVPRPGAAREPAGVDPFAAQPAPGTKMRILSNGRYFEATYSIAADGRLMADQGRGAAPSSRKLLYRDPVSGRLFSADGRALGLMGVSKSGTQGGDYVQTNATLQGADGRLTHFNPFEMTLGGENVIIRSGLPPGLGYEYKAESREVLFDRGRHFEAKTTRGWQVSVVSGGNTQTFKVSDDGQSVEGGEFKRRPDGSFVSADGTVYLTRSADGQWSAKRWIHAPLNWREQSRSGERLTYEGRWVADPSVVVRPPYYEEPVTVTGAPRRGRLAVSMQRGNDVLLGNSGSETPWLGVTRRSLLQTTDPVSDLGLDHAALKPMEEQVAWTWGALDQLDQTSARAFYDGVLATYGQWSAYDKQRRPAAEFRADLDSGLADRIRTRHVGEDYAGLVEMEDDQVVSWYLGAAAARPVSGAFAPAGTAEPGTLLGVHLDRGPGRRYAAFGSMSTGHPYPGIQYEPLYPDSAGYQLGQFAHWLGEDRETSSWRYVDAHARRFAELAAKVPDAQLPAFFRDYVGGVPNPYNTSIDDDGNTVYRSNVADRAGNFTADFEGALRTLLAESDSKVLQRLSPAAR
ncbi:MAG: hypothetical protein HYZ75_18165 [Elusimicrobia bacterium]|nr:hypothetical protein [Elusimicrobiota bacterium]